MMIEDMIHMGDPGDPATILMAASLMRKDAPWLYELAMEVYRAVKAGDAESIEMEMKRLRRFSDMMQRGPWAREFVDKESYMIAMEFPRMLDHMLMRMLEGRRTFEPKKLPRKKTNKSEGNAE